MRGIMRGARVIPVVDREAAIRAAVTFLALLGIVGCEGSTEPVTAGTPTVAQVVLLSGNSQVGAAWTELPEPLRVRVTDVDGDPIERVPVRFRVTTGHGSLSDVVALTDADGVAESGPWTLGPLSGEQRSEVVAGAIYAYFSASASPPLLGPALPGQIAFVSDRDGNAEIYSVHGDGSGLRRLTENVWPDTSPAWSPDGSEIAFAAAQGGFGFFTIYTMTLEGSNIVRQIGGLGLSPTWSPDGSTIAYSTQPRQQIALVGLPAGQPTLVTDNLGSNLHPSWSPDGLRLAFATEFEELFYAVWTSQADGSDAGQRFPNGLNPAWSPDGSTIAFLNPSGNLISLISPEGVLQRYLAWVGDRRPGDYDAAISPHGSFAWSPDGSGIVYTFVDCDKESQVGCLDDAEISVNYVSVDGTQHGRIIENGHSPSWRP